MKSFSKNEGLTCLDEVKEVLISGLKAPSTYKAKACLPAKNSWLSTTTSLPKFIYVWMVDTDSVWGGLSQNDSQKSRPENPNLEIFEDSNFKHAVHFALFNLVELYLLLEKIQHVLDRALACVWEITVALQTTR